MSRLHFGIVAVVLAVLSFTQCRDDPVTTVAPASVIGCEVSFIAHSGKKVQVSLSVPDPKLNCTQYGENQTACCERPSCAFVNCTVNKTSGDTHIGCHNLNNDTDTKDAAKICGVNVTAINKTNVCQAPVCMADKDISEKCTPKTNHTVCIPNNGKHNYNCCPNDNFSRKDNTCSHKHDSCTHKHDNSSSHDTCSNKHNRCTSHYHYCSSHNYKPCPDILIFEELFTFA
uniref:Uncharacterized protein n=1 Tax=Magallana gigas TaxID=29159 RepID=K1PY22_MAGGI